MNVIGIDTGKRRCGMAWYKHSTLTAVELTADAKHPDRDYVHALCANSVASQVEKWAMPLNTVVVEFPRIYRGSQQEKDQNDLLDLAAVAGGIAAQLQDSGCFTRYVHVSDWKGQLTKAQAWHHIWKRLSPVEQDAYSEGVNGLPKGLWHNVQDAVGIGLWACGRFK